MQDIINDFEKKNCDLHNLLSKVHDDHQKQLELLKREKAHSKKVLLKIFLRGERSKQNFVKTSFNFSKHRDPPSF